MNLLFLAAIVILTCNAVLLFLLLIRSRYHITYILTVTPEPWPEKRVITPNELRESAWESWLNAHPNATPIEQNRAQWVIEKEAHKLERKNQQRHPFADPQKKPR